MPNINHLNFDCPMCNQVDMVQKVSALIEGGTVSSIYSHSGGQIAGITLSAKASQLNYPSAPIFKKSIVGPGSFLIVLTGSILGLLFLFVFIFSLPFANNYTQGGNEPTSTLVILAVLSIVFLGGTYGPVIRRQHKIHQAEREQHRQDVLRWDAARSIWNELYYVGGTM
jgi:hypothetical protein